MGENSQGEAASTDLFGDPVVAPAETRGRPKFTITPQMREIVKELKALGMKPPGIATEIGCSPPTLKNYFFLELQEGPAKTRAKVLRALMKKVEEGNVPAIKLALQYLDDGDLIPHGSAPRASDADVEEEDDAAPTPEKLGKKAAANLAALDAHEGTSWGDVLQ